MEKGLYYSIDGVSKRFMGDENHDLEIIVSGEEFRRTVKVRAKKDIVLNSYFEAGYKFVPSEKYEKDPKGDLYFMNGYQSWTDSREYYGDAQERNVTRLPRLLLNTFAFDRYGDASFYSYDKKILHGYDIFYVKGSYGAFVLNLNYKRAYLIAELVRREGSLNLTFDVNGKVLKSGEEFIVADYAYAKDFDDGLKILDKYFSKREVKKIFGYTSWYNYYQNVNEEILLRDLAALDERFNLFQIDDGYETFVGDWLSVDKNKFPRGLKPIVDKAKERGFTAGIWLAPFVAEEKSEVFKSHPDWFKKEQSGKPYKCGSNWSGFYALDLENEEVKDYIRKCLTAYMDMGFDFFKLDFLYAANLPLYEGKTRSEAAEYAYSFLREVLKDKIILGCGATLFNAIDKFDYLRVGPDVSLAFDDVWFMRFMHRERISTKTTLQNTIFRSIFDGRLFGNDPDVFLLRDDNINLSEKQKDALMKINALFGSVLMTSDNVASYDEEKKKKLDFALDLFKNGRVINYSRKGDEITVEYDLNGIKKFVYNTEKGEVYDG
ncbi:MAG: alpha-galactosidase [Clostridia bacterium]|nr:alpha-galactosidase [Clostridia bacterium]